MNLTGLMIMREKTLTLTLAKVWQVHEKNDLEQFETRRKNLAENLYRFIPGAVACFAWRWGRSPEAAN
jgi:hypothetical protein